MPREAGPAAPLRGAPPLRLAFLVNPRAGGCTGRAVADMIPGVLARRGLVAGRDFEIELTRPGEVERQAAAAAGTARVVAAVGGDGTILEVIRGVVAGGTGAALGVVPIGTGNDFSRTLGLYRPIGPRSRRAVEQACDVLLGGRLTRVDLLEINGRILFASYLSFGADARVAWAFARQRHRLAGRLLASPLANKTLYVLLGFRHLRNGVPEGVRLRVAGPDGRLEPVSLPAPPKTIIVSNVRHYAGGSRLAPLAEPADGRFEVTVVPATLDYLWLLLTRLRCMPARVGRWPRLRVWQTSRIEIELGGPAVFQVDGEDVTPALAGLPRLEVTVGPRLPVVVPA